MTQQLRTSPETSPETSPHTKHGSRARTAQPPQAQLTLVHGGRARPARPGRPGPDLDPALERARANALRDRHAEGLTRLLSERDDLRGVHALADLVDDAIRWSV